MTFEMKPLPYDYGALEPHISARTLEFHYDKHHVGYMKKLEAAIQDTPRADQSLEQIIVNADGDVFNNAAQVWNHDFYWQSLSPDGGGEPNGELADALRDTFGDIAGFREAFRKTAAGRFGSGWAWLVVTPEGELEVNSTLNAGNPVQAGQTPLLTIDVWEHAYYLDVQNDRGAYLDRVLDSLLNWEFAARNFKASNYGKSAARKAG